MKQVKTTEFQSEVLNASGQVLLGTMVRPLPRTGSHFGGACLRNRGNA